MQSLLGFDFVINKHLLFNIILLVGRWGAGLHPPTICAKSYMAYNAFRHYYRIKLQNGVLLAANALFS
jgi:hypothetical protein